MKSSLHAKKTTAGRSSAKAARLKKRLQISEYLHTLSQLVPEGPCGPPATQLEVIHRVIGYISSLEQQLAGRHAPTAGERPPLQELAVAANVAAASFSSCRLPTDNVNPVARQVRAEPPASMHKQSIGSIEPH